MSGLFLEIGCWKISIQTTIAKQPTFSRDGLNNFLTGIVPGDFQRAVLTNNHVKLLLDIVC